MAQPDVKVRISAVDETKAAFNSVARGAQGLKNAIFSVQGAIAGVAGGAVVKGLIDTNASFQRLQASLQTFTGSAAAAAQKFNELQTFAAKTPFSLQEIVEGFNILKARGLDPSIASFEAFGNIASGTGKSINQLTEAVADAAVGEFERLKEFGIKANKEGDNIKFTFGGITTNVRNNSTEILNYLEQLGNVQFSGAMERQAQTLDGAFSNFGDAVDALAKTIGESGLNQFIVDVTRSLTGMIGRLNEATRAGYGFVDAIRFALTGGDTVQSLAKVRAEMAAINAEIDAAESQTPGMGTAMTQQAARLAELKRMEKQLLGIDQTGYRGKGFVDPRIVKGAAPAPVADTKEVKKAADEYAAWMRQFDDANTQRHYQVLDIRSKAEEDALEQTKKAEQEYFDWMQEMREGELQRYGEMIDKRFKLTEENTDGLKNLAKDLGMTFTSAFEDAIVEGKKFSDVLKGLAQDILRIATRKLITEPLGNALTEGFKSIFGGGKAIGGSVQAGNAYMVGERGPELFVPSSSGSVVPNNKLNSADGGVVINQTINVTTGVQQTVRAEIMTLMPQIAGAAKAAVADAKLRGGSYAAALR